MELDNKAQIGKGKIGLATWLDFQFLPVYYFYLEDIIMHLALDPSCRDNGLPQHRINMGTEWTSIKTNSILMTLILKKSISMLGLS